jgi:hypothetical protein
MRRRLLAAFVFGLASVTFWAAAIPFAQEAPVAIAFNVAQGPGNASVVVASPQQSFTEAVLQRAPDDLASLRFDWRQLPAAPTPEPTQATPVPLSSPAPQDEPTAAAQSTPTPEPTSKPDPTPTPRLTSTPEPTQRPTAHPTDAPDPTPQPTPRHTAQPTPSVTPSPTPKTTPDPTPKPTPSVTPSPTPRPTPEPTPPPASYSGPSHFWYPALNIDADWSWYGCDYGGDPNGLGGGVFRWGCGPASNIYLLGHAWSTFKKVRIAFHSGAMQVGQSVWYSNAQGDVTKWQVSWIRRVTAEYLDATAGDWALNDSATPIMTLQTCDGSQSQYRIIVRLVPAD